jgi:ATP adenylyltransferase
MKNLWAPWRMEYITSAKKPTAECIFEAAAGKPFSKKDLILYRDRLVTVLINRFPYANGHLLVAPARHLPEPEDLSETENSAIMRMLQQSVSILRANLRPHGFNLGLNLGTAAGAGLADHLHWHIVPRWDGDHNFIAVVGEIRTIPEHLETTFDKLLPAFQLLLDNQPKTS